MFDEVTQLPSPATPIGPLRRGEDGKIETIGPEPGSSSIPVSCAPEAICVGAEQRYRSLSDALAKAHDGDVIEILGGVYRESAAIARKNLTVRGVAGRPHFDCAGIKLGDRKACLLLSASGITLDNLEISGAQIPSSSGADAACLRSTSDSSVTLQRIICHGSQEGVVSEGGAMVIENSEFFDNGWTDRTHNAYFDGDCSSITIRGSTFRDARAGNELTSRCAKTSISDSTFRSTKGGSAIDIPDGGDTMIYRSTIVKTAGARSPEILGFTTASCRYPGSLVLKDVRIVNSRADAKIRNHDACPGHAITLETVTIEGAPPMLFGDIRRE